MSGRRVWAWILEMSGDVWEILMGGPKAEKPKAKDCAALILITTYVKRHWTLKPIVACRCEERPGRWRRFGIWGGGSVPNCSKQRSQPGMFWSSYMSIFAQRHCAGHATCTGVADIQPAKAERADPSRAMLSHVRVDMMFLDVSRCRFILLGVSRASCLRFEETSNEAAAWRRQTRGEFPPFTFHDMNAPNLAIQAGEDSKGSLVPILPCLGANVID